ncbi:MAG: aminotransferase class I/II-fold pyridoxal phosphate-dependent enzyme [Candidatus Moduliflexus flocculans]|nr:aminotransferase class I/II-fold pyridoxal phosphate-dependent enzyme [Candidatus Moduliflexus flocculans]
MGRAGGRLAPDGPADARGLQAHLRTRPPSAGPRTGSRPTCSRCASTRTTCASHSAAQAGILKANLTYHGREPQAPGRHDRAARPHPGPARPLVRPGAAPAGPRRPWSRPASRTGVDPVSLDLALEAPPGIEVTSPGRAHRRRARGRLARSRPLRRARAVWSSGPAELTIEKTVVVGGSRLTRVSALASRGSLGKRVLYPGRAAAAVRDPGPLGRGPLPGREPDRLRPQRPLARRLPRPVRSPSASPSRASSRSRSESPYRERCPMKIDLFKMERMQSTVGERRRLQPVRERRPPPDPQGAPDPGRARGPARGRARLHPDQRHDPAPRAASPRLYPGIGPEQILATAGSSEANFLLMWSLIEPGDEVLFELPNYMQMGGLLRAFGARGQALHRSSEEPGLAARPRRAAAAGDAQDQAHRPDQSQQSRPGPSSTPEVMKAIVDLAEGVGAWILADEVYQGAELSGVTDAELLGDVRSETLVVNGLSKAYGLPGLRIGWIVGPEDVVKRTWPYHDYTTISPVGPERPAGRRSPWRPATRERILARTRGILNANFPVLETWLKDHGGLFSFRPPKAGAICFARYGLKANSTDLVERLIREQSVLVVPGDHFETRRLPPLRLRPEAGYLLTGPGADRRNP